MNENQDETLNVHLNFARTPLLGEEMRQVLRRSGTKNREFAIFCGAATREWTRNFYEKNIVPLKIAVALREYFGEETFNALLLGYRNERDKRQEKHKEFIRKYNEDKEIKRRSRIEKRKSGLM